jgi:hypothetical protein
MIDRARSLTGDFFFYGETRYELRAMCLQSGNSTA